MFTNFANELGTLYEDWKSLSTHNETHQNHLGTVETHGDDHT